MRKGMKARITGWVLVLVFLLVNLGVAAPVGALFLDDAVCETPAGGGEHCCTFCIIFCKCTVGID